MEPRRWSFIEFTSSLSRCAGHEANTRAEGHLAVAVSARQDEGLPVPGVLSAAPAATVG